MRASGLPKTRSLSGTESHLRTVLGCLALIEDSSRTPLVTESGEFPPRSITLARLTNLSKRQRAAIGYGSPIPFSLGEVNSPDANGDFWDGRLSWLRRVVPIASIHPDYSFASKTVLIGF